METRKEFVRRILRSLIKLRAVRSLLGESLRSLIKWRVLKKFVNRTLRSLN